MRAKVELKRNGIVSLRLEDGRLLRFPAKQLNAGMQQGDTGTIYPDRQMRRYRIRLDSSDVLPPEIPRDIITPKE